jgi:triacylglycerol lipase
VISPADGARIAWAVETMYTNDVLLPELPADLVNEFELIEYIAAEDSPLGLSHNGRIFYGFLAQSKVDPKQYVVAIRGTETTAEWIIDAEAVLINHVHAGFFSVYASMMCNGTHPAAGITKAIPPDATVTVIGHSLGAPLACYLMNDLIGQRDCYGLFYAMPKPGDAVFAAAFKASEARYSVFNYSEDVVPKLPLNLPGHRFVALPDVTIIPKSPLIPDGIVSNHQASNYAALLAA